MARNSNFQRGSGVYTCGCCNKKTRETGEGESNCRQCIDCYTLGGLENAHNDGNCQDLGQECDWCKGLRDEDYCTHSLKTPFKAEVAQCTACYIYFAESTKDGNAAKCPECNGDDRIYRTWMTKEVVWLDSVTPADPKVAKHMEEN